MGARPLRNITTVSEFSLNVVSLIATFSFDCVRIKIFQLSNLLVENFHVEEEYGGRRLALLAPFKIVGDLNFIRTNEITICY